jgi:hypothetical protein
MSYSCRLYKNTIPDYAFIRGQIQIGMFKKNILQVVMFQNVLLDFKIIKRQIFIFIFLMSFEIFVSFQISYTCKHVISYKCKYVLFHLNMLRLCQEINKGVSMSM